MAQTAETDAATEVAAAVSHFDAAYPVSGTLGPLRWRAGSGSSARKIVLMPGAGGTTESFAFVAEMLRDAGLDPLFVDYAGTASPQDLAGALMDLLRHLDLTSVTVLGCSYSAYWIQHFPMSDRISALFLCNGFVEAADLQPNPLFDHATIKATEEQDLQAQWRQRAEAQAGSRLGQLMLRAMTGGLPANDLRGRLLKVSSSRPVASAWTGPVTVLDCVDDPLVKEAARLKFRQSWPDAHHITLTEGGHYPYVIAPEAFTGSVLHGMEITAPTA